MSENNPLTAKRDALLSTTLDDQQVIAALKLLKEQYPKLDVMDSMDQIRSVLERDVQHKHEQFLEAYDHLLLVSPLFCAKRCRI
jgi:outer membrane protein assembly factor BamD (BamD/ComL family)